MENYEIRNEIEKLREESMKIQSKERSYKLLSGLIVPVCFLMGYISTFYFIKSISYPQSTFGIELATEIENSPGMIKTVCGGLWAMIPGALSDRALCDTIALKFRKKAEDKTIKISELENKLGAINN